MSAAALSSKKPAVGSASRLADSIKVLIVDDHDAIRDAVREVLDWAEGLVACGEATGVSEALAVAKATRPDVAIVDLRLRHESGVDAILKIKSVLPKTQCVVLTGYPNDEESLISSIEAGACGYVVKDADCGKPLVGAIRSAMEGQYYLDPEVHRTVMRHLRKVAKQLKKNAASKGTLTTRERRIVFLLAEGHTNAEIARHLGISPKTVKNHLTQVFAKLNVRNRAQAASAASRILLPES